MTYTVRIRGSIAGSYLMAEYACPVHGVFEQLVQRDENGDAPDDQPCPVSLFRDDGTDCCEYHAGLCKQKSPWCISAPAVESEALKVRAVTRGGDMTDRPKGMLDTRGLADGMKMSEWKKVQRSAQRERRHQQLVAKGIRKKRIQVG